MKLVTAAEMKQCDKFTIEEIDIPSLVLMEHAALAVTEEILSGGYSLNRTLILCGMGNNGGDGLAIARLLFLKGHSVEICLLGNLQHATIETKQQLKICHSYKIPILESSDLKSSMSRYSLVVDSVLVIGLNSPVYPEMQQIFTIVNQSEIPVIAVDLPSGLSADTGETLGTAIKAATTVTFQFVKRGLMKASGQSVAGNIIIADIGISDQPLR